MFCSIGVLGVVDGTPVNVAVLTFATLFSAVGLAWLIDEPALVPVTAPRPLEVTR